MPIQRDLRSVRSRNVDTSGETVTTALTIRTHHISFIREEPEWLSMISASVPRP